MPKPPTHRARTTLAVLRILDSVEQPLDLTPLSPDDLDQLELILEALQASLWEARAQASCPNHPPPGT